VPKPSSLSSGLTCKWDAWNHLVEVKDGTTVVAKYEYDGLARRVKKHLDSQSPSSPDGIDAYVHYFYNRGWQVLETRRSASENTGPESLQPEYQYVWSPRYIDAPILRDKNTDADGLCDDERIYYLGDANFNVTTLVDTAGDAVERYVYSPYGVLTVYDATWANIRSDSSCNIEYTYTGRRLDPETGLYYYRHRYYAAELGRFLSMDPVRRADGRNVYWYARNRVTSSTDPQGLTAVGGATLHGIGGAFLDLLFPRGVACASFCGGHFYGGSIPPWGGFKEGIFFGVLWSDKGNCEQGSLKVHVRLIYTTLTFLDDGSTVCEPTAEREFRDGQVIPKARFVTPIAKQKCKMINDGQMQRSPSWPQLPNPPDCSSVTFGWDCDIE